MSVPADAYELHFALSGTHDDKGEGERQWDNNAGEPRTASRRPFALSARGAP